MVEESNLSSISKAHTLKEMIDFWDTHSTADYEDETHEVDISFENVHQITFVRIEPDLMQELREIAHKRRISAETLINVWLRHNVDQLERQPAPVVQE